MYTIKYSVCINICVLTWICPFLFFPPPFLWTIADCKRKKGHDSALRLSLHPSTELSSSHNKSCGAGQSHNLNQVTVTHHEAHPENSVWQRHSWKQISSLLLQSDCRYETKYPDFLVSWHPASVVIMGLPNMDASQGVTVRRESQWHPLESLCH